MGAGENLVMGVYDKWTDAELLEEADERQLNSEEAKMLDSMMKQSKYRGLTPRQRGWLITLLENAHQDEDDGGTFD